MFLGHNWGCTEAERTDGYPCDALLAPADAALFRGTDVAAPAGVVFRWLCQLKTAPYSYDWLDNGGRRSPPALTPGLERLQRGQKVMSIFELADFQQDGHLTLVLRTPWARRLFGTVVGSYLVVPVSERACRLVVKLLVRYPRSLYGAFLRVFLPVGDLLMMRRQLLTLKRLSERTFKPPTTGAPA